MHNDKKIKVGILMGGFSSERHVSVESGRNIYNKLASSKKYIPLPLFLSGTPEVHRLFILTLHLMLKDNADDIHKMLLTCSIQEEAILASMQQEMSFLVAKYGNNALLKTKEISYDKLHAFVDFVFIALHGRPGEDGTLQTHLETYRIPYNGSGIESTQLTINKYKTNQLLKAHGIHVATQKVITKSLWESDQINLIDTIEKAFHYPFIAKPIDDGCSTGVMKIYNRSMFSFYATALFNQSCGIGLQNDQFLIEELIEKGKAKHFLEITGGLLTHRELESIRYEIFEPSESIASATILSLEEKFLAGEGQNITPARFDPDKQTNDRISSIVKKTLEKTATILNIEGYARIDAFVTIYNPFHVKTWIIEVNALPAMTPATCIFHQSALNNYTPFAFTDAIIQYGLIRYQKKLYA